MKLLESTFEKALGGQTLEEDEVARLLAVPTGKPLKDLFAVARAVRERIFDNHIFLYGFIYFSTYCKNNCNFCLYRRRNEVAPRYRKPIGDILDVARALEDDGVHLLDLTMGEDRFYTQNGGERLLELVAKVRGAVSLPLMVSPGLLNTELLSQLVRRGVDWYACYQESFSRRLFARLRKGQGFDKRLDAKVNAVRAGMLLEEGLLVGVGESPADIGAAIEAMKNLQASQVRAMTFRPQRNTPMGNWQPPDSLDELRLIATLRLCFPDKLIPASLDVDGLDGLRARINAGANVVTSVIPPEYGLAGVARAHLDIEERQRTASSVISVLREMGLRVASASTYRHWVEKERETIGRKGCVRTIASKQTKMPVLSSHPSSSSVKNATFGTEGKARLLKKGYTHGITQ